MRLHILFSCFIFLTGLTACFADHPLRQTLQRALAQEDERAIQQAAAQIVTALGTKAGEPETPDRLQPLPPSAPRLTRPEINRIIRAYHSRMQARLRTLGTTPNPASLEQPLPLPQKSSSVLNRVTVLIR